MSARIVRCEAQRLRAAFGGRACTLDMAEHLRHRVTGRLGPAGMSDVAADLLDVAAAVYRCERLLPVAGSTNRYTAFHLSIPLRDPDVWTNGAATHLADVLEFLSNASWSFDFSQVSAPIPEYELADNERTKDRVILFSGGLDSTCGLATQAAESESAVLSSYYTRQKTRQRQIASDLGFEEHVQWALPPLSGRGRSFFNRSFYFLSLAGVLAHSWGIRRLVQFETGILALAVPPSRWYAMTKHAHPTFVERVERLFSCLFDSDPWVIENPFLFYTKRQEAEAARQHFATDEEARTLFAKTETCWSHWACHVHGEKKDPGEPCGSCIPCIVRRTALPAEDFKIDLTDRENQNHERMGQAFRSYFAFIESVRALPSSEAFYPLLPGHVRRLLGDAQALKDVHELFLRFSDEFVDTFFQSA